METSKISGQFARLINGSVTRTLRTVLGFGLRQTPAPSCVRHWFFDVTSLVLIAIAKQQFSVRLVQIPRSGLCEGFELKNYKKPQDVAVGKKQVRV